MVHSKPIRNFILFKLDSDVSSVVSCVLCLLYVLPNKAEIFNMKFLSWFAWIRNRYAHFEKDNKRHSNIPKIKQPAFGEFK